MSLVKGAEGQFKAVAPSGAPFDIVLPLTVTNGSINGGATSITIPAGSVESEPLTVTRTPGVPWIITVDIGDPLPRLPSEHNGYTLVKSTDLRLAFTELGGTSIIWSATMTVGSNQYGTGWTSRSNLSGDLLSDSDFTFEGHRYQFSLIFRGRSSLHVSFASDGGGDIANPETRYKLNFHVGEGPDERVFNLGTGGYNVVGSVRDHEIRNPEWNIAWNRGDRVLLRLTRAIESERTPPVREAILDVIRVDNPNFINSADITDSHLADITALYLNGRNITSLKSGDFEGLTALEELRLYGNQISSLPGDIFDGLSALRTLTLYNNRLSSLPDGLFEGLTSLTMLRLNGNAVNPIPLTVSLEKVGDNQFKAVVASGAPFEIVLPVTVTNGSITGGATTITIPVGSVESDTLTVTRTAGTTAAVTVDIGTLPRIPSNHSGYMLAKSDDLPITIITDINTVPVFSDGTSTTRSIAENTAAATNIGTPITAADAENDTLTYTLSGPDASAFDIDSATGQLRTKAPLDYETKPVYTVTITVADEELSDTITVVIFVIDVNDTVFAFGFVPVAERTPAVRDAIVAALPGVNSANDVTQVHLATITSLNLRSKGITALQSGDFSGLTSLTDLNLHNNELSILPDGTFEGLTALTTLRLGENSIDPMLISVSLEKVADGQFKAVAPTGAPFNIVLPITVTNGSFTSGATTLTIPQGSVESDALMVTRAANTTAHVTVDISALPSLPLTHYGYELVKSADLPIAIIRGINTAPVFTDGTNTTRSIAEHTSSSQDIGIPVSATDTDDDTLTYTLGGTDAASFSIDTSTGQLRTLAALDYEMKSSYSVKVSVSDGYGGTDSITVTINVTDVNERTKQVQDAIVAAAGVNSAADVTAAHLATIAELDLRDQDITSLAADDFDGFTNLTSLDLSQNQLETLPPGIFDNLTSLTSLSLWYNRLNSVPTGIFDTLTNLTTLNLQQNSLTSLPAGVFDELISLTSLHLLFNNFSALSSGVFDKLTSLTELGVSGNYTSLPSDIFDTLTSLTRLSLQDSQLTSLPVGIFKNLTSLEYLTVHNNQLTSLPSGIFDKLTSLTGLSLSNNQITSLPSDIFKELSLFNLFLTNNELTTLPDNLFKGSSFGLNSSVRLQGNPVDPLPITISLKKVAEGQFKATFHTGATFNCVLPLSVTNGSINGGATSITIEAGNTESDTLTVTRTTGTTAAVTVNIGTLPELPHNHTGYALVKSFDLPLTVIDTDIVELPTDSRVCKVGDILAPGESCTYPGTDAVFSVLDDGRSQWNIPNLPAWLAQIFNNIYTGESMRVSTNVDGVDYHFVAKAVPNNSWKIEEIGDDKSQQQGPVQPLNALVYWIDWGVDKIQRANLDGSNIEDLVTQGLDRPVGIAIDIAGGKMYWTDIDTGKIQRANLDGSNIEDLITRGLDGPGDIALDVAGDKMYWTDGNPDRIQRANLDGSNIEDLVPPRGSLGSIALNIAEGKMYWTNLSSSKIHRSNLDGSNVEDLVTQGLDSPSGIALDVVGDKMYWTDWSVDKIQRANLDGSNVEDLVTRGLDNPGSIALDVAEGKMYWIDWGADKIQRANLDGSNVENIITGLHNPADIALYIPSQTIPIHDSTNNVPVFSNGDSTTRSIAEKTAAGTNIGDAISATDADSSDTLTYTLGGTDASAFSINSTSGQLKTSAPLDYETKSSYSVTASVSDGNNGSDSIDVTINITDVNDAAENDTPVFTDGDSTTRSIAENTDAGENIGDPVSATDPDNDVLTYSLGGTDAAAFSIDSTTGQLQTKTELDYETKTSYTVTVSVSDVDGGSDSITVTINVTDVDQNIEDPFSVSTLDCFLNHRIGNILNITITGTITIHRRVEIVTVKGYINDDLLGNDHINQILNAGESINFSITGNWQHDGSEEMKCFWEVLYRKFDAAPAAPTVPTETALLSNYPNPFNPETWIPYQLAKPAKVTISIYNVKGQLVRTLALGHQPAGRYQNRSRAAHWDGKNEFGEPVASGVYFYTLKAGDFTATRKMLIRK